MAEPVAMRQVFVQLGFNIPMSTAITNIQRISNVHEMRLLKDELVETLCKALHHAPAPPAPATSAPLCAKQNLKLMCYWICHQDCLSHMIAMPSITKESVCALINYHTAEQQHCTIIVTPPTINKNHWPLMMEALVEHLRSVQGTTGVPLAYAICEKVQVLEDPDPSTNYATVDEEMIARAPHTGAGGVALQLYLVDCGAMWDIINVMCVTHPSLNHIKQAAWTHNCHAAYWALFDHYLGNSNVDHLANEADCKLLTATYCGKQKRWNFEKYVALHIQQHTILNGLKKYDNQGIDERSKIRYFMNGIKLPSTSAVYWTIKAHPKRECTFEWVVSMYKEFVQEVVDDSPKELIVTSTSTTKPHKLSKANTSVTIEDCYYSREEYNALTADQRKALHDLREKHGKKPRSDCPKFKSGGKRNMSAIATNGSKELSSDSSIKAKAKPSKKAKPSSNHDNADLTRQKN
jgi:hypothetical protein